MVKESEKKIKKHLQQLESMFDVLQAATEFYLGEQINQKNDFKKVLDAEIKYKLAFREYMDKKTKILDYER